MSVPGYSTFNIVGKIFIPFTTDRSEVLKGSPCVLKYVFRKTFQDPEGSDYKVQQVLDRVRTVHHPRDSLDGPISLNIRRRRQ